MELSSPRRKRYKKNIDLEEKQSKRCVFKIVKEFN